MDYDYDDVNDYEQDYDEYDKWEIRINNEAINTFDNKYDATDSLIEEINILSGDVAEDTLIYNYDDYGDLINELSNMSASDFYEYIDCVTEKLNIDDNFKLINLDNDEPDFGEL